MASSLNAGLSFVSSKKVYQRQGKKILLAITSPELQQLMSHILKEYDLCIVATVDEAVAAFDPDFDMVICGLHFNLGRMYELLQYAKTSFVMKDKPFLCVQMTGGILPYNFFHSMQQAFKLLHGDLFLQVDRWRIELGDEAHLCQALGCRLTYRSVKMNRCAFVITESLTMIRPFIFDEMQQGTQKFLLRMITLTMQALKSRFCNRPAADTATGRFA